MSSTETELQKEFELERTILFSDAVFAIAITLLIIEIKFPEVEKGMSSDEILKLFKPVIIQFSAFIFSFFFIGLMWSRHLRLFKYLRSYNNRVIFYNLLFLFFIVCFPFTASGFTHVRPSFVLPYYIYIINLLFVSAAQYLLSHYIFRKKSTLSVEGAEAEKTYLLMQSKFGAIIIGAAIATILALFFIYPEVPQISLMGFYVAPLLMILLRKRLRKYKPKTLE